MFRNNFIFHRGKGYSNRIPFYPYRRNKAWYHPQKLAFAKNPLANKAPEEYPQTWDPRTGVEWMYRTRKRNLYRHWPWARWDDDPVRKFQHPKVVPTATPSLSYLFGAKDNEVKSSHDCTPNLSPIPFSKTASCHEGIQPFSRNLNTSHETPLPFSLVADSAEEYRIADNLPLQALIGVLRMHTAPRWSLDEIRSFLKCIENKGIDSISKAASRREEISRFNIIYQKIPTAFLTLFNEVVSDIVLWNKKKQFRILQQANGVLRTREMEQYFSLPHIAKTSAQSHRESQTSGVYPEGRYTVMMNIPKIHPLQVPDRKLTKNIAS